MKKEITYFLLCSFYCVTSFSQIKIQKSPTFVWEMNHPSGSESWLNAANVYAQDQLYASVSVRVGAKALVVSEYMVVNNFNFNIPAGATINGYKVTVRRTALNLPLLYRIRDESVKLSLNNNFIGNNKAKSTSWNIIVQNVSYGGVADLWGTTLTAEDINDPTFGVVISLKFDGLLAFLGSGLLDANIDNVLVEVEYTPSPLPIVLDYFKSNLVEDKVELEWSTISESNNDYFTIEKSYNGIDWIQYDTLKGAGNSIKKKVYKYLVDNNDSRNHYFRLKQTDYDGKIEYFDPIFIKGIRPIENEIVILTELNTNQCKVKCSNGIKEINVYNLSGRLEYEFRSVGNQNVKNIFFKNKGIKVIKVIDSFGSMKVKNLGFVMVN